MLVIRSDVAERHVDLAYVNIAVEGEFGHVTGFQFMPRSKKANRSGKLKLKYEQAPAFVCFCILAGSFWRLL